MTYFRGWCKARDCPLPEHAVPLTISTTSHQDLCPWGHLDLLGSRSPHSWGIWWDLPGGLGFEVRREKQPDVREPSRYFADRVALVQAGNLYVAPFFPFPHRLGHLPALPASPQVDRSPSSDGLGFDKYFPLWKSLAVQQEGDMIDSLHHLIEAIKKEKRVSNKPNHYSLVDGEGIPEPGPGRRSWEALQLTVYYDY